VNKIINITALSILIAAALVGCEDETSIDNDKVTYTTVQECVNNGNSQATCQAAFDQSQAAAAKAPHFATGDDCYAKYGPNGCRQYSDGNGNSWFMPFMVGYMLGNHGGYGYAPVYRSYSGGYQTVVVNNGTTVYNAAPTSYSSARASASSYSGGSATTSARGGFGGGSSGGSSGG
jgi:uncharacterized protein YgiB involved in biofilm formation